MKDFCILGNPRSGTTLLRLILSSHSQITVPPEAGFAVWLYENWQGEYSNARFVDELMKTKKIESWNINSNDFLYFLNKEGASSLVDGILLTYKYFGANTKKIIGDKNNFFIHHINTLRAINPSLKYIHIIRDGRDVACSYIELMQKEYSSTYAPKFATDITEIAQEWVVNNEKIKRELDEQSYILIRLEDLVANPEFELQRICNFLGTSYESDMLNYHLRKENYEPQEYDEWKAKNKKAIENDSFKYRRLLKCSEVAAFENVASESLKSFGYKIV